MWIFKASASRPLYLQVTSLKLVLTKSSGSLQGWQVTQVVLYNGHKTVIVM